MITDIDKIKEFVVSNDCFHDYRLSDLIVNESMFSISFEEDMRTQDNVGGKRVTFKIENYEDLDISIDCIIHLMFMQWNLLKMIQSILILPMEKCQ